MPQEVHNVHDKFFKALLSDRQIAIDWLRTFLPVEVATHLDLNTLTSASTSFVSQELQETFADAVFKCRLSETSKETYVSVLLEHKSYPDKFTAIQLLLYLAQAYAEQWKSRQHLEPVIPILFYQGKQKWEYLPLSALFSDFPEAFLVFLPDFSPLFIDLLRLDDDLLKSIRNSLLSSALLLQKYVRTPKVLLQKIHDIFSTLDPAGDRNLLPVFFVYFVEVSQIPPEKIEQLLAQLPTTIKSDFMNTYQLIIEKGIEKGIEEGIEKGEVNFVLKGYKNGLTLEQLVQITGWPEEKVADIIRKFQENARKES